LDAALLADEAEPGEVERWARAWDVEGVWEFTTRVQASLFAGAPAPRAARVWGRGALEVRDLTVVEQHARRLLSPLAVLPARRALLEMAVRLAREDDARGDRRPQRVSRPERPRSGAPAPLVERCARRSWGRGGWAGGTPPPRGVRERTCSRSSTPT